MSRRDQVRMTDEEVDAFLQGRHTMNVGTFNHDGTIHLVAMWYGFVDGAPAFWTYRTSQKIKNLERNPSITCLVEDGEEYAELRGVELVGRGELITEPEQTMAIGESVFARYQGEVTDEVRPFVAQAGAKRYAVKIHVDKVVSWDHRKLGGTY
jgi:PPOX class probable F420-dependent enzyme